MALLLLLRVVALLLGHLGIALLNPAPGVSSHSLKYFYTAISEDNELLSSFYVVGYMDDQRISQYDSTVRLELPCVSWMKKVEEVDPSYWKDETEVSRNSEQFFKENLVIARNRYNQSRASKLGLILGCAMGILLLSTGIAVYFIKWQHDRRITSRYQYGCQAASTSDQKPNISKKVRDQKSNISKEAFIPHPSHPRGPRAACNSWQESDEGFGSTEEGLERPQILVSTGNQIPADIKGPLYWGLKGSAQLPPGTWRLI
nr:PREDICTED: major histocompatibility complex class I-related gene protein [Anolis carolinensis]|eukprot:XP_008122040.1 PREDICTED: major histocompatibility complex class I-related gene protein [Anolis carolinensis]